MNEVLVKIKFLLPTLPKAEKIAADYILNSQDEFRSMTLSLLSQESKSSEASIIRLSKRLGYEGFSSLKLAYLEAMIDDSKAITSEISIKDSMSDIYKKVIQSNIETYENTLALISESFDQALNSLLKARSIHFFGVGDAFAAGQLAYMKFSRIGLNGSANSDVMLQLITASNLAEGDIAFAISYSGASITTVKAMKIAKESGATTICITKVNKSPLLKYTDINLFISTEDVTIGKDIVSRRVADLAILDALYLGYLVKSKEETSSFLRRTQKAIDQNKT
jgi:DNA-binding MurR/RpiR family transcriptional regulator